MAALGGGAHLRNLPRVAIGPYGIDEAVTLEALKPDRLLSAVETLGGRGRAVVTEEVAGPVSHGRVLDVDDLGVAGEGPWPVVDATGKLLAVYQGHHRQARRRAGRRLSSRRSRRARHGAGCGHPSRTGPVEVA